HKCLVILCYMDEPELLCLTSTSAHSDTDHCLLSPFLSMVVSLESYIGWISGESLAFREEGVLSMLVTDSVLMTLSHRDNTWLLTVYKMTKQSSSFEMLRSCSVPLVSAGSAKENRSLERRPALICVRSGDTPSTSSLSSGFLSDRHVHLEPLLFKLLFGVDAALAKSPVILCGLPDGRLCFLPLHLPGTQLRVLHSLEQPVVFVGASVAVETGSGRALCLVAVGEHGRVVVIKTCKAASEGGSSHAGFTEGCVPGPVVWACVGQQCLYFSTGSDLLTLNLSEESDGTESRGWDKEASSKAAAGLQSPTSLNVCRLIALTGPTHNATGDVELLGLSVRGQLQRITLPVGKEDSGLSKSTPMQVSRSVRDLVSAIGDVCERASVLKSAIKFKNQLLQHLNQVLNISCLLMGWTNSEEKPIRCHAMTSWSRLLQKDSLNLMCVLDNSSPYFLEQGWTLSTTVFPLSHSHTPQGERSSTNFLFPFYNLHPGGQLEVSLPLSAADDTSFPITVSCALIFSLTSLLGEKELASLHNVQNTSVTLPLNTLTVDWLHALQVNSTTTHKNPTPQTNISTTADNIQAFLSSRGNRCLKKEEGTQTEKYSASVQVSSDLLRDTLVMKSLDLEPQAPVDVCVSLLDWLLSDGPGGVKRRHQGDQSVLNAPVVHAQGPSRCTVKLTAKEQILGFELQQPTLSLLLGYLPDDLTLSAKYLLKICGAAAKKKTTNTQKWLQLDPPVLEDWLKIVDEIHKMERLTFMLRLQDELYMMRWGKWISFFKYN
uniref:FA core complex associated protein 100 n=1 Tax=Sphaeramia orbicularis TaxID=375764 RepID=A0A673A9F0_9TELE